MEIKKKIQITGKNWNDLINLPCFRELRHYGNIWKVLIVVNYKDMEPQGFYPTFAKVGDTLVEYTDGGWELIARKDVDDD